MGVVCYKKEKKIIKPFVQSNNNNKINNTNKSLTNEESNIVGNITYNNKNNKIEINEGKNTIHKDIQETIKLAENEHKNGEDIKNKEENKNSEREIKENGEKENLNENILEIENEEVKNLENVNKDLEIVQKEKINNEKIDKERIEKEREQEKNEYLKLKELYEQNQEKIYNFTNSLQLQENLIANYKLFINEFSSDINDLNIKKSISVIGDNYNEKTTESNDTKIYERINIISQKLNKFESMINNIKNK